MEMEKIAQLNQLVGSHQYQLVQQNLLAYNAVDIAAWMEELSPISAVRIFRTLPKEVAAMVFTKLPPESQQDIIGAINDRELSTIIDDLFVDDAVDLLEELPANVVKRVLTVASPETRRLINQFLQYPEDSAGSIMTAELIDLKAAMTVAEAFAHIRRTAIDSEMIYTCYVIDERRRLLGTVSVKDLLLAKYETPVSQVMHTPALCCTTTDPAIEATQMLSRYDLLCLPVVDREHRLVGIITVDDAMDVMQQSATEDLEKMSALEPSDKPYLKTGVFTLARHRILWLLVLMVSSMITGGILAKYEHAFAALPLLVTFIPMLTDTGGNAGSQSATLIIRGMALSEIRGRDFLRVLWKELRVSLLVGVVLCLVNYVRLAIMYPGNTAMYMTVVLALFATVVLAKCIGAVLPMIAKALKIDPAIMASPLITTIVDAVSLILYFFIAQHLLGI